jgi:hypothetical protein
MAAGNKHIIQTMCFDTQASTEETAHAFADRVKAIGCENLLAKVMAKYDAMPHTIRIDQLLLDLGHIDLDDLDDRLEEEITAQLEELLADQLVTMTGTKRNELLAEKESELTVPETIESKIEVLLHYLLTGSLPWNIASQPDMEDLLLEIIHNDPVRLKRSLLPELRKPQVIDRLTVIFHLSSIELLAEKIAGTEETVSVAQIIAAIKRTVSSVEFAAIQKTLAAIILRSLHESFKQQKIYSHTFILHLQSPLAHFPLNILQQIAIAIEQLIIADIETGNRGVYRSLLEQVQELIAVKKQPVEEIIQPVGETLLTDHKDARKLSDTLPEESKPGRQDDQLTADESEQDRYFIDNAGMVLLNAALLQRYFEQLEWVKEKKIVDETSRHKMMVWLDLLVWGERKIHEYGLSLNKVLTGLQPSDVCDIHVTLTQEEKSAANEFLQTIISHWSILKNTGIESLRTTFLQRQGRLSSEDGGWQLHTASKGYDVLIDSLPWSFSIIKFPWMTKPLFTQWKTKV